MMVTSSHRTRLEVDEETKKTLSIFLSLDPVLATTKTPDHAKLDLAIVLWATQSGTRGKRVSYRTQIIEPRWRQL